ncbi:hypothetical protein MMC25_006471 [Agyrium rufum]|nr:hypothetical protein [Agyrium rufum]
MYQRSASLALLAYVALAAASSVPTECPCDSSPLSAAGIKHVRRIAAARALTPDECSFVCNPSSSESQSSFAKQSGPSRAVTRRRSRKTASTIVNPTPSSDDLSEALSTLSEIRLDGDASDQVTLTFDELPSGSLSSPVFVPPSEIPREPVIPPMIEDAGDDSDNFSSPEVSFNIPSHPAIPYEPLTLEETISQPLSQATEHSSCHRLFHPSSYISILATTTLFFLITLISVQLADLLWTVLSGARPARWWRIGPCDECSERESCPLLAREENPTRDSFCSFSEKQRLWIAVTGLDEKDDGDDDIRNGLPSATWTKRWIFEREREGDRKRADEAGWA